VIYEAHGVVGGFDASGPGVFADFD